MVLSMDAPLAASKKVIVLAAATGNQLSSDYDRAEHGLFTHAVLTGLRGAADQDKDGMVTVRELFPYVREQVSATAAEELTREQTPVLLPGEQILGARSAMPVAMVIPGTPEVLKKPTTSLSQVQQELKALEAQEKAMEAQGHQVDLQAQVAEKKRQLAEKQRQIDEKQKRLEVASLPSYSAPKQSQQEDQDGPGDPIKGRLIFNGKGVCFSCHGYSGQIDQVPVGSAAYAGKFNPKPSNFRSPQSLRLTTDEQRFRAIKYGIRGTGMVSMPHISDVEIMHTLAYLSTLREESTGGRQ